MKQHFCLDISIVLLLALFQTSAFAERLELRLLVWEGYAPEAVVKKFEKEVREKYKKEVSLKVSYADEVDEMFDAIRDKKADII